MVMRKGGNGCQNMQHSMFCALNTSPGPGSVLKTTAVCKSMQITNIAEKSVKYLNGAQQLRIETIEDCIKRDHTHYTDVNKANFHPIKYEHI